MKSAIKRKIENLGVIGCFFATILFIPTVLFCVTKMFERSLWLCFNKDVPWYFDFLGACALNGLNFPIWVISEITKYIIPTPFFVI